MITKLRLHNFRTFLNAEIEFKRQHLIIGKNNSGKTNLCYAIRFLRNTCHLDLADAAGCIPGGTSELRNWNLNSEIVDLAVTSELFFPGTNQAYFFGYELKLKLTNLNSTSPGFSDIDVVSEIVRVGEDPDTLFALLQNDGEIVEFFHLDGSSAGTYQAPKKATALSRSQLSDHIPSDNSERSTQTSHMLEVCRSNVANWSYFSFSPEAIRNGWKDKSNWRAQLDSRGDNLPTVLYNLKIFDERRYRRVLEHVQIIEPELEFINFHQSADQTIVPYVGMKARGRATWQGLSDGTLRCLALAVVAELLRGDPEDGALPPESHTVFIEEPENGIYPGILRRFIDEFEERAPQAQVIYTSHSPYFINMFDYRRDSVTLLKKEDDRTVIRPVPDACDGPERPLLAEEHSMELFD
jgi:predicted ATPase